MGIVKLFSNHYFALIIIIWRIPVNINFFPVELGIPDESTAFIASHLFVILFVIKAL